MTGGRYRSMALGELSEVFERLADEVKVLRPLVGVPDETATIFLAAVGPDECSTCTALVPVSALPVWDVNGYYRALGIAPPYRPTKRGLRQAYQRVGGQRDDYATYAFKRLLDTEFRAHYDRRPLGSPVDDQYRWETVRRLAALWAAEQSRATGRAVSAADVLGEDVTARMTAQAEAEAERAGSDAPGREHAEAPFVWPYAYYLWRSRFFDDRRLAAWQQLLVESFARQGLSVHLAVGYLDGDARAARVRHRQSDRSVEILFLHQDQLPTTELADEVVATYLRHPYGQPLDHPIYL